MIPAPITLTTPRLRLEPVAHEHDRGLQTATVASAAELEPWMPWAPGHTIETQAAFTGRAMAAWTAGSEFHFTILREDRTIGVIGLRRLSEDAAEIGYWIASEAAGRGFATEASNAVLEWAFTSLGLQRVILEAGVENRRSRRVAAKLGFRFTEEVPGGMQGGYGSFRAYRHELLRSAWERERELSAEAVKQV